MPEGLVLKAFGGFYFVASASDGLSAAPVPCRARGRLHNRGLMVGDRVEYTAPAPPAAEGVVERVLPRSVEFLRPPVANVDQVVVVLAAVSPVPDLLLADRLLCQAERLNLAAAVCLNKCDLVSPEQVAATLAHFSPAGYPTLAVSAQAGDGVEALRAVLHGHVSTLAGPSGVGKSSLANRLVPGETRATGAVSERLRRGRHTTRHAELLRLPTSGLLADTPGFSAVAATRVDAAQVAGFFPEFWPEANTCRFSGCLHDREPDCAVKAAVVSGRVPEGRYQHYLVFLQEAREAKPW